MPDSSRPTFQDDAGATAIEYGLIAGLVALLIIAGLTLTGSGIQGIFSSLVGAF